MIHRTQHEGPNRIFQPLCLLVAHLQSTKWMADGMQGPRSGVLQLGRKGMQLFCDPSFTSNQAALGIRSTLWGGRTTNTNFI